MLFFVGLGFGPNGLTFAALETLRSSDVLFIDCYTYPLDEATLDSVSRISGKAAIRLERPDLEGKSINKIVELARQKNVCIAVGGDPFVATTHMAVRNEALECGVNVGYVPGVSVISVAFSAIGLEVYKTGPAATVVGPSKLYDPKSGYQKLARNLSEGLHTLLLLGYDSDERAYLTLNVASRIIAKNLDELGISPHEILAIGLIRAGYPDVRVCIGSITSLQEIEDQRLPQCLVIPGTLSIMETKTLILFGAQEQLIQRHERTLERLGGKIHI